ncbi:MAG: chitobiase/beta-hexosaminidase C-terminal domain-containing protein [Saprospiraceae bacterium]|jgi:uncharacterized membrane protein|nr:chitobiase/beta-hexosaminidase C-terminal domain-containing protein [Saprospiraceae bacterium]
MHSNLNFGLACLLALIYTFSDQLDVPVAMITAGRMHPLLLHLPIGMLGAVIFLHFTHFYNEEARNHKLKPLLQWTASFALLTAIAGILLAAEAQTYDQNEIAWHKHTGAATAIMMLLTASWYGKIPRSMQHIFIALNVLLTFISGHLGATITHGDNFLFPEKSEIPTIASDLHPDTQSLYVAAIVPILQSKCTSCHQPEKMKGNLDLTDTLTILKGGKHGPSITWGVPESSLLATRIHLPLSDEEHMPPAERQQLTDKEKQWISLWIQHSSSFATKVNEIGPEHALYPIRQAVEKRRPAVSNRHAFPVADPDEVQRLNTFYRSVRPLFDGSPALHVAWLLSGEFNDQRLQELQKVRENMTELHLAGMPVKDEHLEFISACVSLEKLNVNNSLVTVKGLEKLAGLKNLHSLSLTGTQTDNSAEKIWRILPSLKTVYVSQTRILKADIQNWEKKFPNIQFVLAPGISEKIPLSVPVLKNESTIIQKEEAIVLQHFIQGAKILYTTDGTSPDTIRGKVYEGPFQVSGSSDIQAVAVKDGWLASDVARFSVFEKGSPPPHCTLLTKPSMQYPGLLEKTFTNGEQAPASNLRDPNWIAYRDKPFHGLFSYNAPTAVKKISLSYAQQIPQYVFPPVSVRILAGNSPDQLTQVAFQKLPLFQAGEKDQITSRVLHFQMPGKAYKYYRMEASNLPVIPSWHPGKGEKGWLFIDEIFFYE